jgi:hypothetical protein
MAGVPNGAEVTGKRRAMRVRRTIAQAQDRLFFQCSGKRLSFAAKPAKHRHLNQRAQGRRKPGKPCRAKPVPP